MDPVGFGGHRGEGEEGRQRHVGTAGAGADSAEAQSFSRLMFGGFSHGRRILVDPIPRNGTRHPGRLTEDPRRRLSGVLQNL